MKIHDSLLGLLFVMIGAAILFTVAGYPKMPGQDVGPAMFPGVMAAALVVFGGTLALRGRVLPGSHRLFELREWSQSPRHILAGLSVVLGCAAYALFNKCHTNWFVQGETFLLRTRFLAVDTQKSPCREKEQLGKCAPSTPQKTDIH